MSGKVEEAMEAVREIEKGKGASEDPAKTKGPEQPSGKPGNAPQSQVPPVKKEAEKKPDPPKEDPVETLLKEVETLKRENDEKTKRLQAIEAQKAQVPPDKPVEKKNPLAEYSEEELISYKVQHPEYAVQIEKELHRRTEERVESRLTKRYEEEKQKTAYDQAAYQTWPDLRDQKSEHYKLASQIYNSDPNYAKHPQGFYVAAQAARQQLVEKELQTLKTRSAEEALEQENLKRKKEKDKEKNALLGGGRAQEAPPTADDELEESFEGLTSARPGSPEFSAHLRKLESKKNKSA